MKLTQLMLYIGLAIIGFWLVSLLFKLAVWAVDIALIIGLVLILIALVEAYWTQRKKPAKKSVKKKSKK